MCVCFIVKDVHIHFCDNHKLVTRGTLVILTHSFNTYSKFRREILGNEINLTFYKIKGIASCSSTWQFHKIYSSETLSILSETTDIYYWTCEYQSLKIILNCPFDHIVIWFHVQIVFLQTKVLFLALQFFRVPSARLNVLLVLPERIPVP